MSQRPEPVRFLPMIFLSTAEALDILAAIEEASVATPASSPALVEARQLLLRKLLEPGESAAPN